MSENEESLILKINEEREALGEKHGFGYKWPKSLKQNVGSLFKLGVGSKEIHERCGIPYATVQSWSLAVRKKEKKLFREVSVKNEGPPRPKQAAEFIKIPESKVSSLLNLKTPNGFEISNLTEDTVLSLIKRLSAEGARHAV